MSAFPPPSLVRNVRFMAAAKVRWRPYRRFSPPQFSSKNPCSASLDFLSARADSSGFDSVGDSLLA
jgi:hypothetical protein